MAQTARKRQPKAAPPPPPASVPTEVIATQGTEDQPRWTDYIPLSGLRPHPKNEGVRDHDLGVIHGSIGEHGYGSPIEVDERTGLMVAGHGRRKALLQMRDAKQDPPDGVIRAPDGDWMVPVQRGWRSRSDAQAMAYLIVNNRSQELGGWKDDGLAEVLQQLAQQDALIGTGYSADDVAALLSRVGGPPKLGAHAGKLREKFLVPPFSVLDARQGYWRERREAWISLGIQSELGRDAKAFTTQAQMADGSTFYDYTGVSIFDPVLCELVYRWFAPPGAVVLDPFAGGSVRGVIAAACGHQYWGIDLRAEQVAANKAQWGKIKPLAAEIAQAPVAQDATDNAVPTTPIERRGQVWIKRDDLFAIAGVRGGKVRTCWTLAQGAKGLVTAGSRQSPQVNIVAHVAKRLGIPCRVHVPTGKPTPELQAAAQAGADVVPQTPGHNSVIIKRARDDAKARGWREIPFGMECIEAVAATSTQVAALPDGCKRIVVPVGSGMTLAGILTGMQKAGVSLPVLGVVVVADPADRLDKWAPKGWRQRVKLVPAGQDYHDPAPVTVLDGLQLDPIYESKCIPHLKPDDLLWCVGIRQTADARAAGQAPVHDPTWIVGASPGAVGAKGIPDADLVFTCPPYHDLERYSDDPADLSAMSWDDFRDFYRETIVVAAARLKPNRFMAIVVGEIRDGRGLYRNLVGLTIDAAIAAGLAYYNEAILVTPIGSLPRRMGPFSAYRKLGKTHQQLLVFYKGTDPKKLQPIFGDVVVPEEALVLAAVAQGDKADG